MSILFGICRPEGHSVEERQLIELSQATAEYALDGTFVRANGRIGMGLQPYHTHKRSNLESQSVLDEHGRMLTFDGRLDNHAALCELLQIHDRSTADSRIVIAAFERWGEDCFSKFVGDWAIALWSKQDRSLYLARDHAGTRTLYFSMDNESVYWSTYMETLLYGCSSRNLNRDFIACYLAGQSIGDLTPYRGIDAVTPSHYIVFRDGKFTRKPHWQWMITNTIRCKNDSEYEEHFRSLFRQSIERRTGPGAPILGELSGGMDSTSVLSMSDKVQASRNPPRAQIDSISYYDDSEPAWNERPYFSLVERARGKTGIHVDASLIPQTFRPHDGSLGEYLFPGADSSSIERERRFESLHQANRYRAILSGIGGDELLGGVPTPHPELAGYLASGDLSRFLRASIEWSITNRTSIVQTVAETLRFATGLYQSPAVRLNEIPGWMTPELRRSCIGSHANILPKRLIGFPPNSINNACTWWKMLETLPHRFPRLLTRREWRYPYLDRDLVDFLFSVPRSQLLRPGRRRSLMRRALKDIVPAEILERRRKAVVVRGPFISIQRNAPVIEHLFSDSLSADYGFIDPIAVRTLLNLVMIGKDPSHCAQLMRAISMELWLVSLASNGTRHPMLRIQDRDCPPVREQKTSA